MKSITTARTYDRQIATFLAMVDQGLPELSGETRQWWIENPRALQHALRRALSSPEVAAAKWEFRILRKLHLGIYKSAEELLRAVTNSDLRISECLADALQDIPLVKTETKIKLVLASGRDFGFTGVAFRKDIYNGAKKYGLCLVPPEVGPQLALVYSDQPMGDTVGIGMEPIPDPDGHPFAFGLGHGQHGRCLYMGYDQPGYGWNPNFNWVFAQRK